MDGELKALFLIEYHKVIKELSSPLIREKRRGFVLIKRNNVLAKKPATVIERLDALTLVAKELAHLTRCILHSLPTIASMPLVAVRNSGRHVANTLVVDHVSLVVLGRRVS
eukprot:7197292-Heterocapsa_arctica.AAC.1